MEATTWYMAGVLMTLSDALEKLTAIMYQSPWEDVDKILDWEHARELENIGLPWIPIIGFDANLRNREDWIIGPTKTGRLICFTKAEHIPPISNWHLVPMIQKGHPAYSYMGWYLFPWCPVKPPFAVSDVFKADLWRQPSCR